MLGSSVRASGNAFGDIYSVEAHTDDDTLTLSESGSVHTNLGDGGTQSLKLPADAPAGTFFIFAIQVAQEQRIVIGKAAGKFYDGGTISTDDGGNDMYISADDEGETLTLVCDGANGWFVTSKVGTWGVTQP
jgi:hypothetical protein